MKQYITPEVNILNTETMPLCLSTDDQIITNPADGGWSRSKGWSSEDWSNEEAE